MRTCEYVLLDGHLCDSPCEGRTNYCGSHNRLIRKEFMNELKSAEKRKQQLSKPKKVYAKPNKISEKQKAKNDVYLEMVKPFKALNDNCLAKIENVCTGKTEDVHHSRGRGVYLLIMESWIPVCRNCHIYLHDNPLDAMKRGLSFSRLAKDEPKI